MPEISPEMAKLTELFEGTWRGDEKLHPSEWDPKGGPATGSWTVRRAAGGFCLAVDYDETRDGKLVYHGHGVHAWDAKDRCFYVYWFDNIGIVPKAAIAARLEGNRYGYTESSAMGGHTRMRYVFEGGTLAFSIERSKDGQTWSPMHEGTYRRDPGR